MRSSALRALSGAALLIALSGAALAAEDAVLAIVNGVEIRQSEVDAQKEDLPPQAQQMQKDELNRLIVDQLISNKLLAQEGDKRKVTDRPEFKRRQTEALEQIKAGLVLKDVVKAEITDAKVKAKYDELVAKAPKRDEVRARHILVKEEAEAKKIAADLKKGGDFEKTAKEKSTDPGSGQQGGDLGYFTEDAMVPEFSAAAFKLKKGEISEPVKSQFGWHIIKLEDRREQKPPAFDQVKDQVKNSLEQEAVSKFIASLRTGAKIEDKMPKPAAPAAPVLDMSNMTGEKPKPAAK